MFLKMQRKLNQAGFGHNARRPIMVVPRGKTSLMTLPPYSCIGGLGLSGNLPSAGGRDTKRNQVSTMTRRERAVERPRLSRQHMSR
jgi:hypothetical protein